MFRVGQKVCCVDDKNQGARARPVEEGKIYTIHRICMHTDYTGRSALSVFMRELEPEVCPILGVAAPFALSRFRPIVERKTDISVFQEILRKVSPPSENLGDLIPIEATWKADKAYYRYTCVKCGNEGRNTYCEPSYTQMMERRFCWDCNFWVEEEKRYEKEHHTMTIIDGHVYSPGNRISGSMRGMAGRRFDIEYVEPSAYAGQRITTFDLWSGSAMPEHLRAKFPDTARFLGGAEKAQVGETTCWNHTMERSEPYPLPSSLMPNSKAREASHG